ncbi:MAG: rRNA maturation RNase YbeY [Lachnospiraceae bacterium]|nr:rRNA maturation RNase YbeY [Lachnospiraceae bacterium]
MTIDIEYETDIKLELDYEKIIKDVVVAALDYEECPYDAQVNVVLTDNPSIHEVNRETRQIDRPTDVLSFPMNEYPAPADFSEIEEDPDAFDPDSGELLLGDIMISVEKVKEQAQLYGHSEKRELAFLVAHSMLHLMGYDHIDDEERAVMEKRQSEILDSIGYVR